MKVRIITPTQSKEITLTSDSEEDLSKLFAPYVESATKVWIVGGKTGLNELWVDIEPSLEHLERNNWTADLMIREGE